MRIIDQTDRTISKHLTTKRKKQAFPGVQKLSFLHKPSSTSSSSSSTRTTTEQKAVKKHTIANDLVALDEPFQESSSIILFKELSEFMQPFEDKSLPNFNATIQNLDLAPTDEWLDSLFHIPIPTTINVDGIFTDGDASGDMNANVNKVPTPTMELENASIQNEFRIVCHYCRIMTRFYSVKDPEWNFYAIVNQEFAYRYEPLKYSILAWSSLHLSLLEKTSPIKAYAYYEAAMKSIMSQDFLNSEIPLEILLIGSYFLCLFDIMAGSHHSLNILSKVYHSIKIGSLLEFTVSNTSDSKSVDYLSPFCHQILTWLIYLDIRTSLFVGNIQFPNFITFEAQKKKNDNRSNDTNIQYLLTSDIYEKKVVLNIFGKSTKVLRKCFGPKYPEKSKRTDDLQDKILVILMKNMLMFGTLIRLKNWLNQCGNSTEFDPITLQNKISTLYRETYKLLEMKAQDHISKFHINIELALIHAIIIFFDRILHPNCRTNTKCQNSAKEIFKIAVELKKYRFPGTPGSIQWPFPLFIAGIETTDPIYQNWVIKELEEYEDETWGIFVTNTIKLTKNIIEQQNQSGERVDVGDEMETNMGYFII